MNGCGLAATDAASFRRRAPALEGDAYLLAPETRYFITDHLGSTRVVLKGDGTLSMQTDYLPYGGLISGSGLNVTENDYLWTGDVAKTTEKVKTYQTYTKTNNATGDEVYVGRTSGTRTPEQNIKRRDYNHHMNKQGYGPSKLDKSSTNPDAIRSQEQFVIDKNGGAKVHGGTSGNRINGISRNNPKRQQYENARRKEFGD